MTNAGSITISSSGASQLPHPGDPESERQYGYGIYNNALITNSATGTLAIEPSQESDDARGLYNSLSFTNYGTFTNDRGSYNGDVTTSTWGSYNVQPGTMINYGTTSATGTFHNELIMLNYGTITSQGTFDDNTGLMINYGTFYNYGRINGGTNKGICIDEPGAYGGC